MFKRLGIRDTFLAWIRSYLSDRNQAVQDDGCVSKIMSLPMVSHNSRYWIQLFSQYTQNLFVAWHAIGGIKIYANDPQLYLSFGVSDDMSKFRW